ncbi:MAG: type II toxin-antitoxin system RelE/ParE family toxin [Acidobacteriota bacterium]|nr:type II toxin-antitoxin system RelE/ParE family toxin [Acidobacteriota bacterium]
MRPSSVFVSEAAKEILRHLHPTSKKAIRTALDDLREHPFQGKPLVAELAGLWSLPVARYRIIYRPDSRGVTVVYIGPRRDVYETLRDLLTQGKPVSQA